LIPLVVVENTARWPLRIPGAEVVSARAYLTEREFLELRQATVYNMCRYYGYQRLGYYVSLLAAARGHKPMPSVDTLQALRIAPLVRTVSDDLEEMIQRSLAPLKSPRFELSIYFGRNVAKRYDRLSQALFNQFPAPFLRAYFVNKDVWQLSNIRPIATKEIPDTHMDFVLCRAAEYFARPSRRTRSRRHLKYDLAILFNPEDQDRPSDPMAIRRFVRAARKVDIDATVIGPDDYGRIVEFDALFIRETTYVNHHTYRFARRAETAGLVVIDDPESIIRCTNKVYQAEAFARYGISSPKTLIVHEGNLDEVEQTIGYPCVLKRPDSSFSAGVVRADTPDELRQRLAEFLAKSELVVAQEFTPSEFDWRVGVLAGRPLHVAKYFMAPGHWQIVSRAGGRERYGGWETVAAECAPRAVVRLAVRAASLMGNGLYGVDIKLVGRKPIVMEVNDNPSLEAGCEDEVLGEELYLAIMRLFRERLDARGRRGRGC
jgi:glutathione synthase/RimK-type ligase-like ATP-grasp enzyme